ncbi:MAG: hypothetical protein M1608_10355 [Candidatus Omnitrophica bacterium]|nr:hypothetical protein [Candidatus Omnitrophota bacterium]
MMTNHDAIFRWFTQPGPFVHIVNNPVAREYAASRTVDFPPSSKAVHDLRGDSAWRVLLHVAIKRVF